MSFPKTKRLHKDLTRTDASSAASQTTAKHDSTTTAILKQLADKMHNNEVLCLKKHVKPPSSQMGTQPQSSTSRLSSTAPPSATRRTSYNKSSQSQNQPSSFYDNKETIVQKAIEEVVLSVCRRSEQLSKHSQMIVLPIATKFVRKEFERLLKDQQDQQMLPTLLFMPRELENLKVLVFKEALFKLRYEYAAHQQLSHRQTQTQAFMSNGSLPPRRPETTTTTTTYKAATASNNNISLKEMINERLQPQKQTSLQGFREFHNDQQLEKNIIRLNCKDIQSHLKNQMTTKQRKLVQDFTNDQSYMSFKDIENREYYLNLKNNFKLKQTTNRINQNAVLIQNDLATHKTIQKTHQDKMQQLNDLNVPATVSVGLDQNQMLLNRKENLKQQADLQKKQIQDKNQHMRRQRQFSLMHDRSFLNKLGLKETQLHRKASEPNPRDTLLNFFYTNQEDRRPKIKQSATQAAVYRQKSAIVNNQKKQIQKTEIIQNLNQQLEKLKFDQKKNEKEKNLRNLNRQYQSEWNNQMDYQRNQMDKQLDINEIWQEKHQYNDRLEHLMDRVHNTEDRQKKILNGREQRDQIKGQKLQRLKECNDL